LLPDDPLEANFAYPFLSPSIARSVLSELGELAGTAALYRRYGICLYDSESRATAIVEEIPDTEGYGGQIRIRAKGEGAADLLARLVKPPLANGGGGPKADPAGHAAPLDSGV